MKRSMSKGMRVTQDVLVSGKLSNSFTTSTFFGQLSSSKDSWELFLTRTLPLSQDISSPFFEVIFTEVNKSLIPGLRLQPMLLCFMLHRLQLMSTCVVSAGSQQLCPGSQDAWIHRKML